MAGVWSLCRLCMAAVWHVYGTCTDKTSTDRVLKMTGRLCRILGNRPGRLVKLFALLGVAALVPGCAVKGYDLGWRVEDRFSAHLGVPLDTVSGCRWRTAASAAAAVACDGLIAELDRELAASRLLEDQPGLRCNGAVCSYRNVYERRDVGLAFIVPVYRKIVVREVRARFENLKDRWRVTEVVVVDTPPPNYGPVRIGG